MPRTYKRKTNRRSWKDENMIAAIHAVKNEGMSCNMAAITFEVPEATMRRWIKKSEGSFPEHGGRFKNVFNREQSQELTQYLTEINHRFFGLTKLQCRKLVFQYAEKNKIPHPFNKEKQMAGEDWLANFMKANNFSMRTPEATSIGRSMGFNQQQVESFFDLLRNVRAQYNFSVDKMFNADETGLSTVPTKLPKVISQKGARRVSKVVSGERGKNVTVLCCTSAIGVYIPPFLVFPRKRMRPELLNGLPPGAVGYASDSGWMNTELFVLFLQHLSKHAKPSKEDPILLLVDNHLSHTSLPAIIFCRENGIIMLGFPAHTTHRLQPLDVAFFGPLKTFYSQQCDNYMITHPGQGITDKVVGELFGIAYGKAATVGNATKGFQACGIEPFNPQVFNEEDFAPAITSERNYMPPDDVQINNQNDPSTSNTDIQRFSRTPSPKPSTSKQQESSLEVERSFSFYEVQPLPKADRENNKRRRASKAASVITSSPNQQNLLEKQRQKVCKTTRKNAKKARKNFNRTSGEDNIESKPGNEFDICCPGCDEVFVDPPDEDWIECKKCKVWWHEACSAYEGGGDFICGYC